MKKLVLVLLLLSGYVFSQTNCELCVEQNGFYCGDDESNWTQYSPNGCVPNGFNGLNYLNDGWEDCVSGADEQNAVPTTLADCGSYVTDCDTVYIEVPLIQYEYIFDTIVEYETIFDTIIEIQVYEEIDTLYIYDDILDTLFIDVIEYVEIFVVDTIVETEFITEYLDCDTGMPCNTSII